jgi:hypothetical protein
MDNNSERLAADFRPNYPSAYPQAGFMLPPPCGGGGD